MTNWRLGINTCFAVKRWPEPTEWARIVREEWGLDLVQHSLDLVDIEGPDDLLRSEAKEVREACERYDLTLDSTFTGLAAYSSNLFGIVCVALVKIRHVRGYKRRLILAQVAAAAAAAPANPVA